MDKKTFLTTFFNRMNEEVVDYFVYGSYLALPDNTGGSDIDILIGMKDVKRALHILKEIADANDVVLASYYKSSQNWFVRLITISWGVQVDFLGGGYYWKSACYYKKECIMGNVISHRGIKVLDICIGYYIDFFKEVIHIGKAKEKYIDGFIAEYSTNPHRRFEVVDLYGEEIARIIDDNLDKEKLATVIPQLSLRMRRAISHGIIWKRIRLLCSKLQRMLKRPGYVMVVLGTDGSGKTTIIDAITPWLNECFHHGVIYNHLRPNVLPDLGVLLGKKEKSENPIVVSDPHAEKPSGLIGSLVRWGYYMLDYTIGYLKSVYPVVHTKSKVFIFDRYYYDYYVDQKRSRTSLPQWILRLGELFVPRPDLILCLGGDPQKIYERKPETSLEEVSRQTRALRKFCDKHNNAVWIDTTLLLDETLGSAKAAIMGMLTPRFKNVKL